MWTTPYSQNETRERPNVKIDVSSILQETSPQKPAVANWGTKSCLLKTIWQIRNFLHAQQNVNTDSVNSECNAHLSNTIPLANANYAPQNTHYSYPIGHKASLIQSPQVVIPQKPQLVQRVCEVYQYNVAAYPHISLFSELPPAAEDNNIVAPVNPPYRDSSPCVPVHKSMPLNSTIQSHPAQRRFQSQLSHRC
jgi:hypothetical protein